MENILDKQCPKCGGDVFKSEIEGYVAQCLHCDEDFYGVELEDKVLEAAIPFEEVTNDYIELETYNLKDLECEMIDQRDYMYPVAINTIEGFSRVFWWYVEQRENQGKTSEFLKDRPSGREQLHPAITDLFDMGYAPINISQLVIEYPHISTENSSCIAYTRNESHGEEGRFTINRKPAGYLKKFFPQVPDHVLRDIVTARCKINNLYLHIIYDMRDIIEVMNNPTVPGSCMVYDNEDDIPGLEGHHPYEVYDPYYGWALAIMTESKEIDDYGKCSILGRALVYEDVASNKAYVRTYGKGVTDNGTQISERMDALLEREGYENRRGWPNGAKLARIDLEHGRVVCPYLDGGTEFINIFDDHLEISGDGEYGADTTQGYIDVDTREVSSCEDCGCCMYEDEEVLIEVSEGERSTTICVCQECYDNNYIPDAITQVDTDNMTVSGYHHTAIVRSDMCLYVEYLGWVEIGEIRSLKEDGLIIDTSDGLYPKSALIQILNNEYIPKYRMEHLLYTHKIREVTLPAGTIMGDVEAYDYTENLIRMDVPLSLLEYVNKTEIFIRPEDEEYFEELFEMPAEHLAPQYLGGGVFNKSKWIELTN